MATPLLLCFGSSTCPKRPGAGDANQGFAQRRLRPLEPRILRPSIPFVAVLLHPTAFPNDRRRQWPTETIPLAARARTTISRTAMVA